MSYKRAYDVFPEKLLKEMQKYIQGEMVYIPSTKGTRKGWGENSGNKVYLRNRNYEIWLKFREGLSIDQLTTTFCLSYDSIKKIIYTYR